MNHSHRNNYEQKLDGLLPLTIIFFLFVFSGFFYFLINEL
ncbi:hypothetical protein J2Z65_002196 [Paenibacillus aceris]|uniref:YqzM family protein n=1 Tax=Paenibacillus aceris TaxID=869555 RepID=A0ABS4HWG1_9BACL|nr:hypothetical protein [Paenibacillus aceris]